MNSKTIEVVQDQSTNNLHLRGLDREDGTPTALCNKRFLVCTYASHEAQVSLRQQYDSWNKCPRCEKRSSCG